MAGTPIAGTNGRVTSNGVILNFEKWSFEPKAVDLPSSNFESGGYEEGIMGFLSGEITIEGFWDAGLNPHGTPNLVPGAIVSNVICYVNRTGARAYTCPSARCITTPVANEATGKVMFTAKLKTNGAFTLAS